MKHSVTLLLCVSILCGCKAVPPAAVHSAPVAPIAAADALDAEFDRVIKLAGEVARDVPDNKPLTPEQIAAQARWSASKEAQADREAIAAWPHFEIQPVNYDLYK